MNSEQQSTPAKQVLTEAEIRKTDSRMNRDFWVRLMRASYQNAHIAGEKVNLHHWQVIDWLDHYGIIA